MFNFQQCKAVDGLLSLISLLVSITLINNSISLCSSKLLLFCYYHLLSQMFIPIVTNSYYTGQSTQDYM